MELTMETAQPAASTTWKLTVLVCCSGAPRWGSAVALAGSMSARRAATYAGESSASVGTWLGLGLGLGLVRVRVRVRVRVWVSQAP